MAGLLPLITDLIKGQVVPTVQANTTPFFQERSPQQAQPMPQPAQPQQDMSWYQMKPGGSGIGGSIGNFFNDPERMARMTLALNSMRLSPDQGIAAMAAKQLENAQQMKLINAQANKTVEWLKSQNRDDLAQLVKDNPSMAKTAIEQVVKGTVGTETIQTRQQTAKLLGFEPGSEGYKRIISGGQPSDIQKEKLDKAGSIRGEFNATPAVKDFSLQSQAYGRIVSSATDPSAAGDLALIFNYMKILDPGSTVREGEFATAQNAAGVDGQVRSLFNRLVNGERLNPDQRADFVDRAGRLYNSAEKQYSQTESFYKKVGQNAGLDTSLLLPNYRYLGGVPSYLQKVSKPAGVSDADWNMMTPDEKRQFVNAGR